jgi:hypothetical protein
MNRNPGGSMDLSEFQASLDHAEPPTGLHPPLLALWVEARGRGDWDRAHRIVQAENDRDSAWVHAYLHRREGDAANARFWYSRSGRQPASGSLEGEWDFLVDSLLNAPD